MRGPVWNSRWGVKNLSHTVLIYMLWHFPQNSSCTPDTLFAEIFISDQSAPVNLPSSFFFSLAKLFPCSVTVSRRVTFHDHATHPKKERTSSRSLYMHKRQGFPRPLYTPNYPSSPRLITISPSPCLCPCPRVHHPSDHPAVTQSPSAPADSLPALPFLPAL